MNFVNKITLVFLLTIGLFPMMANALGVIDRVEVVENKAKSEVDITLYFQTNVRPQILLVLSLLKKSNTV